MPGGLYIIWFSDHHYYGGQTNDFKLRWAEHFYSLKKKAHKNPHAQAVYNKYGQFRVEVLEECSALEPRMALEQKWLDAHFGHPGCLNICSEAVAAPMTGRKHSAETRAKISAKVQGRTFSEETRAKFSAAGKRRIWTSEIRSKISESLTGQKRPYMVDRNKANAGWRHTDENKLKISEAGKRPCSMSTRQKISDAHKTAGTKPPGFAGRKHSDETRAKISASKKARKLEVE